MSRSTRRKYATHLHLTKTTGLGIAGRDATGQEWRGIDATMSGEACERCLERFDYGYATADRVFCVNCVVFSDGEDG